jgi:predicted Ser/Thr protein kinase
LPGAIGFNTGKLILVLAVALVLVGAVVLRATRSMGKIEIQIPRNVEKDEALCIEVTKNPKRPPIVDMAGFHNTTKTAGTITKRFLATLVGTQTVMKVPAGVWYVHLYGTYTKSGKLRAVPESCSQKVELRRGDLSEIVFDLVPKLADVTVEITYEPRKDVVVWSNDEHARRRVDADGKVELQLPVGNHRINVQTPTDTITQMLNVPTAKSIRIGINVTRELRLMKDLDLGVDAAQAGELELVLTGGPRTPPPGSLDKLAAEAVARTHALSPAQSAAASMASKARSSIPGPGELLVDRYKITAELGRGAMGVVQRGWDEKLEREVAIKLMADDLRAIPEAMNLFTSEAKALAQLNHTNIVAMYDQLTEADKVYMIMEFVDGQTLESMIAARGAMPWFEAASIIDQVCAGLAYAHARKVIHRDIKPANIFVAHDNTVKLGDFGLARVMREVTIRRTEVRGTPLYMAPEQITGTDIDHRTDLYAVGCTLFELVTGRPPFTDGDIMYAQMNAQPHAPSTFAPDLPPGVDDLVLALLAKSPQDRPASANEVRAALRALSTM